MSGMEYSRGWEVAMGERGFFLTDEEFPEKAARWMIRAFLILAALLLWRLF